MLPVIFCPACQTYLGSQAAACPSCGRERLPSERLPAPGQPLWRAALGGAVQGVLPVGDLVVFNYGRIGKNGVSAFQQITGEPRWTFETPNSVEAEVAQFGERLYFATRGVESVLYCLRWEDGSLIWKQALNAAVRSRPLLSEARVYVGQDDGQVRCFDSRNGTPLCYKGVGLPHGRVWLEWAEAALIAFSERGRIIALNPQGLNPLWHTPLEVGCEITSAPCPAAGRFYFGGQGGQVLVLDVHKREIRVLARDLVEVLSAPACSGDKLFVGAHDRRLHAFDLPAGSQAWVSPPFDHSISRAPFASAGLVVTSVNQVGLALLEAQTGKLAWCFPVEKDVKLLSHPVLHAGVIYAGTDQGQVFALPWHLGAFEWAGGLRQAQGEFEEAGILFASAAQHSLDPQKQADCYLQAEACWQRSGRMELAGRLWESLIEEKRAAEAYCQAGRKWIGHDHRQAVEYYSLAAQIYWQLDDEQASSECARKIQKLVRGPLLRIKLWTDKRLTQYEAGSVTFRVENIGREAAENLTLDLGGSLVESVTCQVLNPLPAGAGTYITLPIIPTKAQNNLVIQAEYCAPAQENPYHSTFRMLVDAEEAPIEVEMKYVVAPRGIELNAANPQNRRIRYKLDMVYAASIKTGESAREPPPAVPQGKCPHCQHSLSENSHYCDHCGTQL